MGIRQINKKICKNSLKFTTWLLTIRIGLLALTKARKEHSTGCQREDRSNPKTGINQAQITIMEKTVWRLEESLEMEMNSCGKITTVNMRGFPSAKNEVLCAAS